ncbi:trehalose-phosphatase [Erythrobacter sp. SCSIO 43205]|uniref:trehalose-phosphatase n=1 Tax=Erythrobacter sp. SCSIO 43205 TaxID=2779361 RepID=UPI001CA9CA09|nr:trehalose-phosphatase [Erythrobacter sp. SCSIO 43205]UAB76863.1 trehalose-phosphatase [Erythrobacter sp. SCSIO 43205]
MRSALDLSAPPALATLLAKRRHALFLDFDGTLVELAPTPDTIAPAPELAVRLEHLAHRLGGALALVSGRAITDIESHIGPLQLAAAGSHGSDIRRADGSPLGDGAQVLPPAMEEALRQFAAQEGLDFEQKPHGGALHYRAKPDKAEAADAFAESLAHDHGWSVQRGKCVVEIIAGGADKGSALDALMQEADFTGARPVFIGDDLTDEAGFAAAARHGGFGVLVGERDETCAHHSLATVTQVHTWLEL